MIEPDNTIRFKPDDAPELTEIPVTGKDDRKKIEVPEPKDWRPFGAEW